MSKLGYFDSILSDHGVPIVATITVFDQGTATPSAIYTDAAGTTPLANPFTTDALGRFQFFAAGGTYDLQVSGAGITTYKVENISLALTGPTGPAGPPDGISPETYGAIGDGATDDYAAFVAMFAAIAGGLTTARNKVILNPAVSYRISSRTNATNVFEVPIIESLQMVGPGMGIQTFLYDGLPATNFFHFADGSLSLKMSDMMISGGAGADLAAYPITNLIYLDNVNYSSFRDMTFDRCTGQSIDGFNWMTEIDHCIASRCDVGFPAISTTGHVADCYANNCRIGYEISCWYGSYIGCASDWADVAYLFSGEPWSVSLIGCGCEKALQAMSGRVLELSVQGFLLDQTDVLGELTFTSGGAYVVKVGDTITGATSGKTAVVARVHLTGGSWAGGDAAGTIRVTGTPSGAFQAENINVGANNNVATLAGPIANRASAIYLPQTAGHISGLYGKVVTTYWVDGNNTSPDLIIDPPESFTGSFKSLVKDYAAPTYISLPVVPGYPLSKDYDQTSKAMTAFRTVHAIDLSYHEARMKHEILYADGTETLASTVTMQKVYGPGTLIFRNENNTQGPIVVCDPSSGVGISFRDIQSPIIFRNMYFKLNKNTYMFEVIRCKEIKFENCKFENTSGAGGYVFDIDIYSKVIIDKDTMDDMVTATWNGLDNGRRWDAIEFRGYTAAPIAGLFDTGHRVWFQSPAAGAYSGKVCTAGAAPGTWKGVGLVEP